MPIIPRRSKKLLLAGLIGAGAMSLFTAGSIYFIHSNNAEKNEQYEQIIQELEMTQMDQMKSMKTAWVPMKDFPSGHFFEKKDLQEVRLPGDISPDNLPLKIEDITGKATKIELRKGTPITLGMLYEDGITPHDLRNREMKSVWLPSNLKVRDTVDIRIQFPTGQDYIVLSKKVIDRLDAPAFWTTLSEEEILLLSSAMVDAYLHKASLYALTYVEPEMQRKAIPNYPPNQEVMSLIKRDPNIVKEAEIQLESSIRHTLDRDLQKLDPNGEVNNFNYEDQTLQQGSPDFNTWQEPNSTPQDTSGQSDMEKKDSTSDEQAQIYDTYEEQDNSISSPDVQQRNLLGEAVFSNP